MNQNSLPLGGHCFGGFRGLGVGWNFHSFFSTDSKSSEIGTVGWWRECRAVQHGGRGLISATFGKDGHFICGHTLSLFPCILAGVGFHPNGVNKGHFSNP